MTRWEVAHLDELDRFPVDDGGLLWRPVRRRFDIRAFGANAYTAERAGQRVVEEHTETGSGHEEIYVVATGRATFTVGDEALDAPAGTLVHLRPGIRRGAVAAEDGTTVLAFGGARGRIFEPSEWEVTFAAYGHLRTGDADAGRVLLEEAAESDPTAWQPHYHLACFAALGGARDEALDRLERAFSLDPEAARWAAEDADLAALRDDPRFPTAPAAPL